MIGTHSAVKKISQDVCLFNAGNIAYPAHFEKIHDRFGDFDLAFMECGQYSDKWHYSHMYPEESAEMAAREQGCYDSENFFDVFTHSLKTITDMLRSYPECVIFELKAYYDNEPEVKADVSDFINSYSRFAYQTTNISITPDQFIEGLDLEMIYRNIYLACEGYLFEKISNGSLNADDMEHDYLKMIDHWKQLYLRRETSS